MELAAVTMVYNEPEYLPIWCRYYGAQLGPEHCYIIDHGTEDGSVDPFRALGFNIVRIPRSPKDNTKRTRFVSSFCSSLLEWYGAVLHSDVDEIAFPNPARFASLQDYVAKCERGGPVSAIGFDIYQDVNSEKSLDLARSVAEQRSYVRFSSSMCKPVIAFQPIKWSPGFHSADAKVRFDEIYLFHLRYFDLKLGLLRLNRTRSQAWSSPTAGGHQRFGDDQFEKIMASIGRMPKVDLGELDPSNKLIAEWTGKVLAVEKDFRHNTYTFDLHLFGDKLLRLPGNVRSALANWGV